jgi:hypothetical protein
MAVMDGTTIVLDTESIATLLARGAYMRPVANEWDGWQAAVIDMAERGAVWAFVVLDSDSATRYYGIWVCNDAGHADICSVHPDDRVDRSFEVGRRLTIEAVEQDRLTDRNWLYVRAQ